MYLTSTVLCDVWCVDCTFHSTRSRSLFRFVFFWIYLMGAFSCVHIEFILFEWRTRWCVEHFRKHTSRSLNTAATAAVAVTAAIRCRPYTKCKEDDPQWRQIVCRWKRPSCKRAIQMNRMNESAQWTCFVNRSRMDGGGGNGDGIYTIYDAWILSHSDITIDMRICISVFNVYAMTALERETTRNNEHLSLKWTTIKHNKEEENDNNNAWMAMTKPK